MIFPGVQKLGSMTPFFAKLFLRRIKKIKKYQKVKISVRRQNPNAFLHMKTHILHKKRVRVFVQYLGFATAQPAFHNIQQVLQTPWQYFLGINILLNISKCCNKNIVQVLVQV